MPLTAKAAVAQMRTMSDGEWLAKNTPQRFRPTTTGMVHDAAGLYVHYQDFVAVVRHFESRTAALQEIADSDKSLTAETPKEQLARCRETAKQMIGGAA